MNSQKLKLSSKALAKIAAVLMSIAIIVTLFALVSNDVSAAPGDMWDLSNFVQSVIMQDTNGNTINPGDSVYINQSYVFNINFTETTGRQLSYDGSPVPNSLIFQLPPQLHIQNAIGPAPINVGTGNVTVGSYTIDTSGQVLVTFNNVDNAGNPTAGNFITNYTNVNFWLNITAQLIDGGDGDLGFGNVVITIPPPVPPPPELIVTKRSQPNPDNPEIIDYIVTITADGDNVGGIYFYDTLTASNASITNFRNSVFGFRYDINNSGRLTPMNINWLPTSNNVFNYEFIGVVLTPGDYITVRYSLDVQTLLIDNNVDPLTYDFNINNLARVHGDNNTGGDGTTSDHINKSFPMSKTGATRGPDSAGNYWIEWTITVGPVASSSEYGLNTPGLTDAQRTITDTLGSNLFFDDPNIASPDNTDALNNISIELYDLAGNLIFDGTGATINGTTPTLSGTTDYFTVNNPTNNRFDFVLPVPTADNPAPLSLLTSMDLEENQGESQSEQDEHQDPEDVAESDEEVAFYDTLSDYDVLFALEDELDKLDNRPVATSENIFDENLLGKLGTFEDIVATDSGIAFGNIGKVVITYNTRINPPPTVPGRPPITYQNNVSFNNVGRGGTVPFNPGAIHIAKQTSGICGNPTNGYTIDYTIDLTIPAGNFGQHFYLYDTLGIMPGNKGVINTPIDFNLTYTTSEMQTLMYALTPPDGSNTWRVYFGTTDPQRGFNSWDFHNEVTIHITYTIELDDDTVTKLQANSSTMLQNTIYLINGTEGSTPGQATAVSVGAVNVNDYWPIFKSAQSTGNPALFNYTVLINGAYSGRSDPLFGPPTAPKDPVFTDTFDPVLSYVPGSFYVRDPKSGAIYAPPPGSDVTLAGNSFSIYFRSLYQFTAPPNSGGAPIGSAPAAPAWFAAKQNYEVHYQMRIQRQYMESPRPNLNNTASIAVRLDECTFESDAKVNYNPQPIAKIVNTDGSDIAHVDIIINPDGGYIFSDGSLPAPSQVVARDILTNMQVYLDQITVYTQKRDAGGYWDGTWVQQSITYNDGKLWSVNVVSTDTIDFILPNQQPIQIVYDALITLPPGTQGTISNEISILGVTGGDGQNNYEVNNSTAGASADALRLRLFKEDPVSEDVTAIPDAVFTLYVTDLENPGVAPYGVTGTPRNISGVNFYPLVADKATDNYGIAIFDDSYINRTFQFLYLLFETDVPLGYSPESINPAPLENCTFFTIKPDINQSLLNNAVNKINSNLPSGNIEVNSITDFITVNNVPSQGLPGSLRIWKLFTGIDITDKHYQELLANMQIVITDPAGERHPFKLADALDPFGIIIENAKSGIYHVQEYNAEIDGYNLQTIPAVPFRIAVETLSYREVVIQMNNIYTIPAIPLPPGVPNYPESLNILKVVEGLTDEQIQEHLKDAAITITGPEGFNETVSLIDAINGVTFENVPEGSYFFDEINADVDGYNLTTSPQIPFRRYILPTSSGAITILITNRYTVPVIPLPPGQLPPSPGETPKTGIYNTALLPILLVALGGACITIAEIRRRRIKGAKK